MLIPGHLHHQTLLRLQVGQPGGGTVSVPPPRQPGYPLEQGHLAAPVVVRQHRHLEPELLDAASAAGQGMLVF